LEFLAETDTAGLWRTEGSSNWKFVELEVRGLYKRFRNP
jgi:hypothetical protein